MPQGTSAGIITILIKKLQIVKAEMAIPFQSLPLPLNFRAI